MNETWKTLIEVNGTKFVSLAEVGKVLLTRIAKQDKTEAELRAKLAEQEDANRKLLHEVMQLSDERVSLKNEAAALRERDRWISVEEKLPEVGTKVLTARSVLPEIDFAWYVTGGGPYNAFFSDGEEDTNVTHWKALSAAPRETERNGLTFKDVGEG